MKFYESAFDYNYSFPAVTLAYFLRYPNPYSRHVLSTDVIDRYVDPVTKRLHTTRLHLKKSKVPAGILKLLPRGLAGPGGATRSYVLEKSTIDVQEGWMETESKNMEWTGILKVVERQTYRRQPLRTETWADKFVATEAESTSNSGKDWTSCKTTVTFVSNLGRSKKIEAVPNTVEEEAPRQGFFASWSTAGIQRTVELIGMKRTKTALVNGKEGMNVVLERLRNGGIVAVLEGMRNDSLEAFGPDGVGHWKQVWMNGARGTDHNASRIDSDTR